MTDNAIHAEYVGTNRVRAHKMTRGQYNHMMRGLTLPYDDGGSDPGYLVEYRDGRAPNHSAFEGHIRWSPAERFEIAYRRADGLPFGLALELAKQGRKIERGDWSERGVCVIMVPAGRWVAPGGVEFLEGRPWLALATAEGRYTPWVASQTDLLADDWRVVE